ncbi:MAG: hypothetical protein E6K43_07425, partial [Gammaproteobacteria bacterium]
LAAAVRDVEEAVGLAPAHLSHYQLTLEPGTVFEAQPPPLLPDDDAAAGMLAACAERLLAAGYQQYEVSAYARAGRQCRHNLNYWTFGDYLGVGAGAHGKLTFPDRARIVRTVQPREPRRYLAAADEALVRRVIPAHELPFEFMLNALRLTGGFDAATFTERTGLAWQEIAAPMEAAIARGLIVRTAKRCRPSELGLRFLNEVLLGFMPETPKFADSSALSIGVSGARSGASRPLFTAPGSVIGE